MRGDSWIASGPSPGVAAVGLYGVVRYGVARRTREIGIRKALGADGPRVVRLLVAGGLMLVVIGGALGLVLAVVATRLLGGMLFEVDALDPLSFVGVPLLLGVATYLPARGTGSCSEPPPRRCARSAPIRAACSEHEGSGPALRLLLVGCSVGLDSERVIA